MLKALNLALLCILLCCSCDEAGEQQHWTIPHAQAFSFYPLAWKELLILPVRQNGQDGIAAVSRQQGTLRWMIADSSFANLYYNCTPYIAQGKLLLPAGKQLWCIDLATGALLWKDVQPYAGESHVFGIKDICYRTYNFTAERRAKVIRYSLTEGAHQIVHEVTYAPGQQFILRTPKPYPCGVDACWLSSTLRYEPGKAHGSDVLQRDGDGLHRYQIYPPNRKGKGAAQAPLLDGLRAYWMVGEELVCYDMQNRAECWRTELPAGQLSSRLHQSGNLIYAACEDHRLYCLRSEDGQIKWVLPGAGTPSRLRQVGQQLFFVGGNDATLYQVNTGTERLDGQYRLRQQDGRIARPFYVDEGVLLLSGNRQWHAIPMSSRAQWLEH